MQVFVVCCVFFAAKLTTIHGRDHEGNVDFLFYVPQIVQTLLLETGLLACVVVVIVAQLMPQIVASLYPVQVGSRYSDRKWRKLPLTSSSQPSLKPL